MKSCKVIWKTPDFQHPARTTCDEDVDTLISFLECLLEDQFTAYQVNCMFGGEYLCYGDGCWVLVKPEPNMTIDEAWKLEFDGVELMAWVCIDV